MIAEVETSPYIDLGGDIAQQLSVLFLQRLRDRVTEEHQAAQFQAYSERLYASGFRDTVHRRAEQLAERLTNGLPDETTTPEWINQRIDDLFEHLLDFFIIRHASDLNEVPLPEAILKYTSEKEVRNNLYHMVMDYLDFESQPLETVYTDFVRMPASALKNASRFFLFPQSQERIFFICDQSLLGGCREGFAMTDRGLYWKAQLQTSRSVQYDAIDQVIKEKDWLLINGEFFNANPTVNLRMLKLLKKLKRYY